MVYTRFRYLKIACAAAVLSATLGIAGALLILWLMWFGYRKRLYLKDQGNLVAWLSAHVYLGLSLFVIATLHIGFHFGWNVHTLAYVLMCLVIASGGFGILSYVRYPRVMTENRPPESVCAAAVHSRKASPRVKSKPGPPMTLGAPASA